jgi:hypothetical protein
MKRYVEGQERSQTTLFRQPSGSELALPGTTADMASQSDCLNPDIETLLRSGITRGFQFV